MDHLNQKIDLKNYLNNMTEVINLFDKKKVESEPRSVVNENVEIFEQAEIPTREDVVDLIMDLARKEGVEVKYLQLDIEAFDDEGNLLSMVFNVAPQRARSEGWEGISYEYYLAGRTNVGNNPDTEIFRVNYQGNPPLPLAAGIIGKYIRGQWYLEPGKYNPTAKEFDPE
mgnify:FL=1